MTMEVPAQLTGEELANREERIRKEAFERGHMIGMEEAELPGPAGIFRWSEAMHLATRLAGQHYGLSAVLDPTLRKQFMEAVLWFHVNLAVPPGEGDPGWEGAPRDDDSAGRTGGS